MHSFHFVAHLLVQQFVLGEVVVLLVLFGILALLGLDARVEDFDHEKESEEEFDSAHGNAPFMIHVHDAPSVLTRN